MSAFRMRPRSNSLPRSLLRFNVIDFLVRIEHHEVVAVRILPIRRRAASLLSADRVFDLDDLGAEPGERLGDGGARLELREINHLDAGQGRLRHGLRLWHRVHIPYLEYFSSARPSHSIHFPTRACRAGKGGLPRANWPEPRIDGEH